MDEPLISRTPLSLESIRKELQTAVLGRNLVEVHESIDSTNLRAWDLAQAGAAEGALVLAETQTSGRGRLGRVWHSPPGQGLYFSLVLRPDLSPESIPLLTLAAGLGAARAIEAVCGLAPGIKWPNDLTMGGRKVAGILCEMEIHPSQGGPFVIMGLGLNVNLEPSELPPELSDKAGSLYIAFGRGWDRTVLLARIFKEIEDSCGKLVSEGPEALVTEYRRFCETLGKTVVVSQGRESFTGLATDVDASGCLVVVKPDGERVKVNAGEVTLSGSDTHPQA